MLGQEEAVPAGLAEPDLQGIPGAHRPGRQMVEEGGLPDPGDRTLDMRPAAQRVEMGRVAVLVEELAAGFQRAGYAEPPAPVRPVELGHRIQGMELLVRAPEQFVGFRRAVVEALPSTKMRVCWTPTSVSSTGAKQ